jgi:hypothetical protein
VIVTIMILEPLAPFAPQRRILAPPYQRAVLQGDHRLIVISIERPRLNLTLAAFAGVQHPVKRMVDVIAFDADFAQPGFEFVSGQQIAHRRTSMPS